MDRDLLQRAHRAFVAEQHVVNVLQGEWLPLYREDGEQLVGIRGRAGAFGLMADGKEIGGDLIEMQPGSSFGTHVHEGDHLLYCIRGEGQVYIDGEMRHWEEGDTVFIAADFPHGVTAYGIEHFRQCGFLDHQALGTDLASERPVHEMRRDPSAAHRHDDGLGLDAAFVILAIGAPHKHVDDHDRMHLVDDATEQRMVQAMRDRDREERGPVEHHRV